MSDDDLDLLVIEFARAPREWNHQLAGSTHLGPGLWADAQGAVHFSVLELLAFVGLPDHPANRAECIRVVREVLGAECPDTLIVEQELE